MAINIAYAFYLFTIIYLINFHENYKNLCSPYGYICKRS